MIKDKETGLLCKLNDEIDLSDKITLFFNSKVNYETNIIESSKTLLILIKDIIDLKYISTSFNVLKYAPTLAFPIFEL